MLFYHKYKTFVSIKSIAIIWGTTIALVGYIHFLSGIYDTNHIKIIKETIYSPKIKFNGFKIVLFSDLHIGFPFNSVNPDMLSKLSNIINMQNPDIVIFAGDLLTNCVPVYNQIYGILFDFFNSFISPVYYTSGNHDRGCTKELYFILNSSKIHPMDYKIEKTRIREEKVLISGIPGDWIKHEVFYNSIKSLIDKNKDAYSILVSHIPDFIDGAQKTNYFDLQLSGHTHGGQLKFFVFGIVKQISRLCAGISSRTLKYFNMIIHISRGIGTSALPKPQYRLGVRPEITVLSIKGTI